MLAGSRRHLQSAGASRQGTNPRPTQAVEEVDLELPPYQEPRLPLTDAHQKLLRDLSASRFNASLQRHNEQSAKLLTDAVYVINDRVVNRKEMVDKAIKRRRGNNNDGEIEQDAELEKVRAKADELKDVVDPLTLKLEEAMRDVVDIHAALLDEKEILKELPTLVAMAQAEKASQVNENVAVGDDDEQPEAPEVSGTAIHTIFAKDRESKAKAYAELSMFQKYAKEHLYIGFKRNWHDGLNPGDEIPVADPKTWFDSNGQPVIGGPEEDYDDEIQIAREVRSFRCPLSLSILTEPYTCRRCKHSFQKEPIFDYLAQGPQMKCPETGCNLKDMTVADLFLDESLARRIKRAAQAEREQANESSDREEEEESREERPVDDTVKAEASADEGDAVDEDGD